MAVTQPELEQLYLAYFGRPPDFDGLIYYTSQSNMTIWDVAAAFSASPESQALYGTGFNAQTIDAIYMNLFNRHADNEGLIYWSQEVASGRLTAAGAAYAILLGAHEGQDRDCINNKLEISHAWLLGLDQPSEKIGYAGTAAADVARDYLAKVDWTSGSVTNAMAGLDAAIAESIGAHQIVEYQLTTGQDTIVVQGDGPNTVTGLVSGLPPVIGHGETYTVGDSITGNGETLVKLVVTDPGLPPLSGSPFAFVKNVAEIDLTAGTRGQIGMRAGGWDNVGAIMLNDGVDGLQVNIDQVDAGTKVGVTNVVGSISGTASVTGGDLYLWAQNSARGGAGANFVVDANGNVDFDMGDHAAGSISSSDSITLGDVTVSGGDDNFFRASFSSSDDLTVGSISVSLGDDSSVVVSVTDVSGDATIGDVTLSGGDEFGADVNFTDISGDLEVGQLTVSGGESSSVSISVDRVYGNATIAGIDAQAGADSSVDAWIGGVTGDLTIGDVTLVGGNVDLTVNTTYIGGSDYVSVGGDLNVGNVFLSGTQASISVTGVGGDVTIASLTANATATADVYVNDNGGDVTIGDITASGGTDVSVTVEDNAGNISLGNVTLASTDSSSVDFAVMSNSGTNVSIGNVTVSMGDDSDLSMTVQDAANVSIGDITVTAGAAASVDVYVAATGMAFTDDGVTTSTDLGDITVGDISATAGDLSFISVSLSNWNNFANAGNVTAGNVTLTAGDDSEAYFYAWNGAFSATTEFNDGTAAGSINVGDVSLTVGNVSSIDSSATASVTITNEAWSAAGAKAGSVTVGDINIAVGNGFVSGTLEQDIEGHARVANYGLNGMGDLSVGNVNIAGGDFANLSLSLSGYADSTSSTVGNLTAGDVIITGGEHVDATVYAYWGNFGSGAVLGDLTVGDVTIHVAQDSFANVSITHTMTSGASMGNLTVGDVGIVMGDNSHADVNITQNANFSTSTDAVAGDFTVGDISVAVSATTSVDLSGGSSIEVDVVYAAQNLAFGTGGDVTVGDVTLSAGNTAEIDANVTLVGTLLEMGNVSVGAVSMTAGDNSNVAANVVLGNNVNGNIASINAGGLSANVGFSSDVSLALVAGLFGTTGTIGDVTIGDANIHLGGVNPDETAPAGASLSYTAIIYGRDGVGDVTVGDLNVDAGAETVINNLEMLTVAGQFIGHVEIGDVNLTLGDNVVFAISPTTSTATTTWNGVRAVATSGDIGGLTAGDLSVDLGAGVTGAFYYQAFATGSAGTLQLGDVDISGAGGSAFNLYVSNSGDANDTIKVGGISAELDGGATATINVNQFSGADITVGNVTVTQSGATDVFALSLDTTGDVTIGNIKVSGDGVFHLDGATHATGGYIAVGGSVGTVTVGDVDFSEYGTDATLTTLDLSWALGAAHITGGAGKDTIIGNDGANTIAGGANNDTIDGGAGNDVINGGTGTDSLTGGLGNDTFKFAKGDSTKVQATVDVITDFTAGTAVTPLDKLSFGLAAGTSGNYVEQAANFASFSEFLQNAANVLNGTVKYYIQDDGVDTYVAVNYGSGEADLVVKLAGVTDCTALQFQNFIA